MNTEFGNELQGVIKEFLESKFENEFPTDIAARYIACSAINTLESFCWGLPMSRRGFKK